MFFWLVECNLNGTVDRVDEGDSMDLLLLLSRFQHRGTLDMDYIISSSSTAKLGKSLSINCHYCKYNESW